MPLSLVKAGERLALERPARLRRAAELVDLRADLATDPEAARELARKMRVRAAELECGSDVAADETIAEIGREIAEDRRARAIRRYRAA